MLEFILATHFVFNVSMCPPQSYGCYIRDTQTIYVDSNLSDFGKEKVIYHELGHHIFGHDEETAEWFSWWMLNKAYPDRYIITKDMIRPTIYKHYFDYNCKQMCIDSVLEFNKIHHDKNFNNKK